MNLQSYTIDFGSPKLFLTIGDTAIPVCRLSDHRFVFTINGVQKALGYEGKSDSWLLNILQTVSKFSPIPKKIIMAYENPIKATFKSLSENNETIKVVEIVIFIETCKTIVLAKENGWLGVGNIKVSKVAQNILKQIENQNIDELAAEACGFNTFKEAMKTEFIQYLLQQTSEPAFLWIKTFPDTFFTLLFKIHSLDWKDLKTQPHICGKWLIDVVFSRLSSDLLANLRAKPPKRNYRRKQNLSQENNHPELKKILAEIIILMETAALNWFIFMQLLNRAYPIHSERLSALKLEAPKPPKMLSIFSSNLKNFT